MTPIVDWITWTETYLSGNIGLNIVLCERYLNQPLGVIETENSFRFARLFL